MMRIITGKARGTHLVTLAGENTRPTAERAKEAVFSMLQFELADKQVLDLFAGSGQMALEAISRGAAHAVLCDASREAIGVIRKNAEKTRLLLQCDILCGDYRTLLQTMKHKKRFDIVFLDPPYAMRAIPEALRLLIDCRLLSPNAKLVCETAGEGDVFLGDDALASRFEILRVSRYGAACVTILQSKHNEEETK